MALRRLGKPLPSEPTAHPVGLRRGRSTPVEPALFAGHIFRVRFPLLMVRMVSAFSLGRGATGEAAERRRNLIAISVASFLASVGFMVVMPFLPGLLREVTGGDGASTGLWLGFAISIAPLMTALTGPLWTAMG